MFARRGKTRAVTPSKRVGGFDCIVDAAARSAVLKGGFPTWANIAADRPVAYTAAADALGSEIFGHVDIVLGARG
jgi:hypothetical protein